VSASPCEWADTLRDSLAPLRADGRLPSAVSGAHAPRGAVSSVDWSGLLPFLRHALLFSHCCLSSTPA
jgi:hypothetical protein